jgi:hypothetical protein
LPTVLKASPACLPMMTARLARALRPGNAEQMSNVWVGRDGRTIR